MSVRSSHRRCKLQRAGLRFATSPRTFADFARKEGPCVHMTVIEPSMATIDGNHRWQPSMATIDGNSRKPPRAHARFLSLLYSLSLSTAP